MNNDEIIAILEGENIKATSNRILVMRALSEAERPVNLADLEESLETMDKASIFRVLELLTEHEIVHVIEDGSRSVKYEMCVGHGHHSISDQHVHFYCERCKETFCLESVMVPVVEIPEGYEARSANYVLKGLCPDCK